MKLACARERAAGCVFRLRGAKPTQAPALNPRLPRAGARSKGIDEMTQDEASAYESPQFLHLVLGGELKDIESHEFRDPAKIDVVGVFPDYESAERAWRAKAQATVDSAQTRYFIVDLHRFLEPKGLKRKPA